jgi:hypothetical protein
VGLTVKRSPPDHAGGKWRLSYASALGRTATLEVDINFMLRTPLWPPAPLDSRPVGGKAASRILVLDAHELAAGKLAALVVRSASRDLFDARELLRRLRIDPARLRLAFTIYGGINREDWRSVTVDRVTTRAADVDSQLVPMLRSDARPKRGDVDGWTEALIRETRALMAAVLPLREREFEFLERLNGSGEIAPELLTDDPTMQAVIRGHPGLAWKAINVREHKGAAPNEPAGE